jgi:hypothetical protein
VLLVSRSFIVGVSKFSWREQASSPLNVYRAT